MIQSDMHNVKLSGSPGTGIRNIWDATASKPNLLDYLEIWELCL